MSKVKKPRLKSRTALEKLLTAEQQRRQEAESRAYSSERRLADMTKERDCFAADANSLREEVARLNGYAKRVRDQDRERFLLQYGVEGLKALREIPESTPFEQRMRGVR